MSGFKLPIIPLALFHHESNVSFSSSVPTPAGAKRGDHAHWFSRSESIMIAIIRATQSITQATPTPPGGDALPVDSMNKSPRQEMRLARALGARHRIDKAMINLPESLCCRRCPRCPSLDGIVIDFCSPQLISPGHFAGYWCFELLKL